MSDALTKRLHACGVSSTLKTSAQKYAANPATTINGHSDTREVTS
jgi:hypothetical protein